MLREQIRVKGKSDPVPFDVIVTRHGPLMQGVLKNQIAPLALRWTALDGGRTMDSLLGAARATDWSSFRAAMADLSGATLSVCYADVDGHIGYVLAGALPGSRERRWPAAGPGLDRRVRVARRAARRARTRRGWIRPRATS